MCACVRAAKPPRRCSQSQSNTVYTDLLYDQHWFPAAAERSVVESDPDLVISPSQAPGIKFWLTMLSSFLVKVQLVR